MLLEDTMSVLNLFSDSFLTTERHIKAVWMSSKLVMGAGLNDFIMFTMNIIPKFEVLIHLCMSVNASIPYKNQRTKTNL